MIGLAKRMTVGQEREIRDTVDDTTTPIVVCEPLSVRDKDSAGGESTPEGV